jgi:hypothetical protein
MLGNGCDDGLAVEQAVWSELLWGPFTHNHQPYAHPPDRGGKSRHEAYYLDHFRQHRSYPVASPSFLGPRPFSTVGAFLQVVACSSAASLAGLLGCYSGLSCPHRPTTPTILSASDATVNLLPLYWPATMGGLQRPTPITVHHTCPHVSL